MMLSSLILLLGCACTIYTVHCYVLINSTTNGNTYSDIVGNYDNTVVGAGPLNATFTSWFDPNILKNYSQDLGSFTTTFEGVPTWGFWNKTAEDPARQMTFVFYCSRQGFVKITWDVIMCINNGESNNHYFKMDRFSFFAGTEITESTYSDSWTSANSDDSCRIRSESQTFNTLGFQNGQTINGFQPDVILLRVSQFSANTGNQIGFNNLEITCTQIITPSPTVSPTESTLNPTTALPTTAVSSTFVCLDGACNNMRIYRCEEGMPCSIRCDGRFSCKSSSFYCPSDAPCNIECTNQGCENTKFYCPANAPCDVECRSCWDTQIMSSSSSSNNMNPVNIDCVFCLNTLIQANRARNLSITCGAGANACYGMTIYCPPSSTNGPNCFIEGGSAGGSNGQELDFYLYGGWQDIVINSKSTSRTGNMFCGSDYGSSCTTLRSSDGNAAWECENGEVLDCVTDEPTSAPTGSPVPPTTLAPSFTPTSLTFAPTQIPSQSPSSTPTVSSLPPTMNPTPSPTNAKSVGCGETAFIEYIESESNGQLAVNIDYEGMILFNATSANVQIDDIQVYNLQNIRIDQGEFDHECQCIEVYIAFKGRYEFIFVAETDAMIEINVKCVSAYPTQSPTYDPTLEPTKVPTFEPTLFPTLNPTMEPTVDPMIQSNNSTKSPSTTPTRSVSSGIFTNIDEGDTLIVISVVGIVLLLCVLCFLCYVLRKIMKKKKQTTDYMQDGIATDKESELAMDSNDENMKIVDAPEKMAKVLSVSEIVDQDKNDSDDESKNSLYDEVNAHSELKVIEMMKTKSAHVHQTSSDSLYADNLTPNHLDNGPTTDQIPKNTNFVNGEDEEGQSEYQRIGELLETIYGDEYEKYLNKFRKEMVTDQKLFDDVKFRMLYNRRHSLWKRLIDGEGARYDFFQRLYGDV